MKYFSDARPLNPDKINLNARSSYHFITHPRSKKTEKRTEKGFMKITVGDNFDDMPDGMEEYLDRKEVFN